MSDSSSLINNQTAVSSDCLFNLKPSSVRARSYRASVPSSNKSSFIGGDVGIFYIPGGRRNTYLDPQQSYIRFTVQYNSSTAADAIYTDHCGAGFINRLDIYHGSNLLETVQQYNVLYNYLIDFQFSPSGKQGLSSVYGTGKTTTTFRQGLPMYGSTTAANAQRLTFCLPLLSATCGLGSDKFIPIGALADDIRLEFTFENNDYAVAYTASATGTWTITSAELELQIVELSDEGQSMVESVTPFSQPVILHGNSWRHYTSTVPSGATGGFSYLVSARFASLKSLVVLPRKASDTTSKNAYSLSSRINPNFANYWFRIGAYIIPNKMVSLYNPNNTGGYTEAYMEIIKSFHSLTMPQYASGIPFDYYNCQDQANDATVGGGASSTAGGVITALTTGANTYQNAFAIAQELEQFANRSDLLISGMNTLASQIFFEGNIQSTGPTSNYTLDFYANYDVLFVLQDGLLSAKF